MSDKAKKILKYGISIVIAALCIRMVVHKVDWTGFVEGLKCTRWGYIVLFIAASLAALVFRALRWRDLIKPLDSSTSLIDTWDSINIGNTVNVALPGAGELLRCGLMSTRKATYDKTLGTILMERVWDVLAIIVILIVALSAKWSLFGSFFSENIVKPASGRFNLWWLAALAAVAVAAFIAAAFRFRERSRFFSEIADAVRGLLQGLGTFSKMDHKFRFACYTVGLWGMYIIMSWFGLKAVPALSELTFIDALFISAVGNLAAIIPVPSGMGPYHYLIMISLTGLYGCTGATGLLYAVLCHETHAILIAVLGLVSYVRLTISRKNKA